MAKVVLLDGNSLAYRAFFALPTDMATASGQVTNAVYGFTAMLLNLLKDHRPDAIAVAFDRPEPTFRHELVPGYKAGRAEAPDILRQQMGLVRQVVETLRIPVVEAPGYEADDVIATLATRARDRGDEVLVVTGDRDAFQLVEDPAVRVLYNRRGVTDYVVYDEAGILERTGVPPAKYPELAALRGDPSDNLPGVPGVGEKTAARLLSTYGDLDGIYAHLDDLPPKLRESLAAHEADVRRNLAAIRLVRDVPIDLEPRSLRMGAADLEEVRQLFGFLEFRSLWERLAEALGVDAGSGPQPGGRLEVAVEAVSDPGLAREQLASVASFDGPVALEPAWEGQPGRSGLLGLALVGGGLARGRPGPERGRARRGVSGAGGKGADGTPEATRAVWLERAVLFDPGVLRELSALVGTHGVAVVGHHVKELMRALLPHGVDVRTLEMDTAVAAYLLEPTEGSYELAELASRYAGLDLRPDDAPPPGELPLRSARADPALEAARRAGGIARLHPVLRDALERRGLVRLHDEVERPLVRVLAKMEVTGIRVDVEYLRRVIADLSAEARALDAEIQRLAGEPFVVNSTPQLRRILYEKLGLTPSKRTKTGYSTDAASLERLRGQHPIVDALLRYREVEKLRSTYGDSLLAEVGPDGRIHASFNQTVARTGRLSSDQPNLHNIPVRSDEGLKLRRAFVPEEGFEFLVADYNQIELRVIAHLTSDPGLIEAFSSGTDVHTATAARVFGVPPSEVTPAQRAKAKMVSYGLAYGMEAYGLSERLGISVAEAEEILRAYFEAFPTVRSYMEKTVAEARERGYTETLFGRRRQIPELSSSNYRVRQAGERQAMNAGIQGLAADIFKVALVRLDASLEGLRSRLVLQVHDEVLLEVPPDERDKAAELTLDAMRHAADLRVPLEVNLSFGPNWAEAKA